MQQFRQYFIYILASKKNGVLYIGVTNSIERRVEEHKNKLDPNCFTAKYNVNLLVYFETFQYIDDAIKREKQLKKWNRQWKINLIEEENKDWKDLSGDWNN
ncbi:GIY-YIG nuclease family protein [Flavobacterium paronense]|uniref:GIY-YIG nuclease family protein n=1 Tax=Flavobacterium paronense TaxID=1392775 RepID=A0ABV5GEA7_9FLAO|nr:GIY-YIG nuclease family protein [Flavobacterium paronense]MDN3678250.1 GIY-YIG nuclease family protein [Flavobacterium paronense]